MKILIISILIVAISEYGNGAISKELMLSVRPLLLDCAEQNRVTEHQLKAIIANDLSDQSPNIQCLSLCFFQKIGMMDANANVNVDRTIIGFSLGELPSNVIRVVHLCKDLKGYNPCNKSARIYACYLQNGLLINDESLMTISVEEITMNCGLYITS